MCQNDLEFSGQCYIEGKLWCFQARYLEILSLLQINPLFSFVSLGHQAFLCYHFHLVSCYHHPDHQLTYDYHHLHSYHHYCLQVLVMVCFVHHLLMFLRCFPLHHKPFNFVIHFCFSQQYIIFSLSYKCNTLSTILSSEGIIRIQWYSDHGIIPFFLPVKVQSVLPLHLVSVCLSYPASSLCTHPIRKLSPAEWTVAM